MSLNKMLVLASLFALTTVLAANNAWATIINVGATDGNRIESTGNVDTSVFDAGTYGAPSFPNVVTVGSFLVPAGTITSADFSIFYQGIQNNAPGGMTGSVTVVGVRSSASPTIVSSDYTATGSGTTILTSFVTTSTTSATTVSTGTNAALLAFINAVTPGQYAFLGLRWDGGTAQDSFFSLYRFDTNGGSLSSANLALNVVPEPGTFAMLLFGSVGLWLCRGKRAR